MKIVNKNNLVRQIMESDSRKVILAQLDVLANEILKTYVGKPGVQFQLTSNLRIDKEYYAVEIFINYRNNKSLDCSLSKVRNLTEDEILDIHQKKPIGSSTDIYTIKHPIV